MVIILEEDFKELIKKTKILTSKISTESSRNLVMLNNINRTNHDKENRIIGHFNKLIGLWK
jgi:hypothetical protein